MFVIKNKKIFFILSAIIVGASLLSITVFGLKAGIDFAGGAIMEVSYVGDVPEKSALEERISNIALGEYSLRPTEDSGFILRTRDLTEAERAGILGALSFNGEREVVQERFNSIGPVVGEELKNKAFVAMGIVVLAIIIFIAFAFRKVSEQVSSWKYGLIAIVALLHDVIVPVGVFALLGALVNAQIDILFVMALLAILGYSVNDTIVVFDRVRENLRTNNELNRKEDFELTVGKSLNQTYSRSVNTSLTTVFVLLALFFFGAEVTRNFALVLLTGVIAGTYSSIFLATPLLVSVQKWGRKI